MCFHWLVFFLFSKRFFLFFVSTWLTSTPIYYKIDLGVSILNEGSGQYDWDCFRVPVKSTIGFGLLVWRSFEKRTSHLSSIVGFIASTFLKSKLLTRNVAKYKCKSFRFIHYFTCTLSSEVITRNKHAPDCIAIISNYQQSRISCELDFFKLAISGECCRP